MPEFKSMGVLQNFKSTDVNIKLLEDTANGIDEDINMLLSISSDIRNSILPNLNPYWQGPAKQNFENNFSAYIEGFAKLIEEYRDLNEQLKKAATSYNNADTSVKQVISKLSQ